MTYSSVFPTLFLISTTIYLYRANLEVRRAYYSFFAAQLFSWDKQTTQLLVERYMHLKDAFRDPKIKKKKLWDEIKQTFVSKGHNVTEEILDRKWRNMKKTYTGIKDNIRKTGRGKIYWEYYHQFDGIYVEDKTVNSPRALSTAPVSVIQKKARINTDPIKEPAGIIEEPQPSTSATPQIQKQKDDITLTPKSTKMDSNSGLFYLKKKLAEIETARVNEIQLLREALEKNNEIQERRNEILQNLYIDHGSIENTNSTTAAVRGQRKKCDDVDEDQSRNITRKQDVQKWSENYNLEEYFTIDSVYSLKAIEPIGSSNEECLKMFNSEEKKKYLDISPNTVSTVNYSNTECIESGIEKTSVANDFENVKYSAPKNTFHPDNSSDNDIRECIDVDDERDKDSILSSTDSIPRQMDMDEINTVIPSLAEEMKKNESEKQKSTRCKFCDEDVNTKNFTRHIERKHSSNSEVIELLKLPKNSKERRNKFILLRNDTNFNLYIKGTTRPNRKNKTHIENDELYYPCAYCKGLFKKRYLSRHAKCCIVNTNNERNHCSASQTLTACAMDTTNVISKLNVKHQVFDLMKPDEVSMEVKKDLLIIHFGESYLRKHRRERMHYTCSSRMRELSRLLIAYRKISGEEKCSLKDMIVPKKFGMVLSAVRDITGYDPERRTYKAPSLAMHLGTTLKQACHELKTLVLQESEGFKCGPNKSSKDWIGEIQDFIKLIESRWTIELSSLAYKDLQEGKWNDQILIPLVDDIRKFKEESIKLAEQCVQDFKNNIDEKKTYTTLVHCSLVLLDLFNRSRIGDVQILKIKDYKCHHETDFADLRNVLTESEKLLTREYIKVVNSGKGSRGKVILIPKVIRKFIDLLLEKRGKYIPSDNEYVFASPGSSIKWEEADVAFREMTKKINLKHPEVIGSNKLRKHIATTMQILNLTKEETKQFSNFMGYTEKSNAEFDELPVDIYETEKLAKILMMMDRGSLPAELKGKSLSDMNIDLVSTLVEENDKEDNNFKTPQKRKASMDTILKDDGESNEITEGKSKRNKIIKKVWTDEEIQILLREFGSHIKERTYPSAAKIQQMLEKTKMRRNVNIVKSKLQHLMRKNII